MELFRQMHALFKKNYPEAKEERFFNQRTGEFTRLIMSRGDFQDDVDFKFELNPDREYDKTAALTMLQLLTPYLMQIGNIDGIRRMAEKVYEMHGLKDFGLIWPEQPPHC